MRRPPTGSKFVLFCLGLLAAAGLQARTLQLDVDVVRSGVGSLTGVQATLRGAAGAGGGELELRAATLDFPLLAYSAKDIVWRCPLAHGDDGEWRCAGPVRVAGGKSRELALRFSPAATRVELAGGGQRISYENQAASPDLSRIELQKIPVAWLQAFLSGLWADGRWSAGELSGRIDVHVPAQGLRVLTDLQLAGIGVETPDGWLAAAGIGGRLKIDYTDTGGPTRVGVQLQTKAGELLVDQFYIPLPATPVLIAVDAESAAEGRWRLPKIQWRDGDVLQADGDALVDAAGDIDDLRLALRFGDLALARDRYLSGVLAPAGFGELVLAGSAQARLELKDGSLRALALAPREVSVIDPQQRFTLVGVEGDLDWNAVGREPAGHLGWSSGALFGIGHGAGRFDFVGADGALELAAPTRIAVLGGAISLDHLRWQPPGDGHGTRFQLGVTMDALDLGSLSQRLGWPPFAGTLAGRIPAARYEDDILALDGGVTMQLFGGSVRLTDLVLERPFGAAPSLSADVAIDDIDLEPLTAAFGFGAITGRLDGRIASIRMVDWTPVAFDARLQTDPAWKGRRRISYSAVEDITKVGGGGGLMGGIQGQALKFFDDFGYKQIALGCRLRNNVCEMSGVDSAGDGYTIVEGAGLPRIQVIGFRRRVDWPTLVDRLEAATEGQAPLIE
jgi:hypothetical protein